MKIRSALRRICDKCEFVRRNRTLFVICARNPKHKQRQGVATLSPAAAESSCDSCATTFSLNSAAPVFPVNTASYSLMAPLPTWASSFQPVNMARSSQSKLFKQIGVSQWNGGL